MEKGKSGMPERQEKEQEKNGDVKADGAGGTGGRGMLPSLGAPWLALAVLGASITVGLRGGKLPGVSQQHVGYDPTGFRIDPSRGSGGWLSDQDIPEGGYYCDIDRVYWRDLSVQDFQDKYFNKKPVVIYGIIDEFWPARTEGRWAKEAFTELLGDARIDAGSGTGVAYSGGNAEARTTVKDYLQAMRGENRTADEEPLDFTIDRAFIKRNPELFADFRVPQYFKPFQKREDVQEKTAWQMVSLGAPRQGLPFHCHGHAWLGLVYGQKRWTVYAPGHQHPYEKEREAGFHPMMPSYEWMTSVLPLLDEPDRPLTCLQLPGDIMYTPAGWKHQTANVGEVLGVGGGALQPADEKLEVSTAALAKDENDFEGHLLAGMGSFQIVGEVEHDHDDDMEEEDKGKVISKLAALYGVAEDEITPDAMMERAEHHLRRCVELYPEHPQPYIELMPLYARMERPEDAKEAGTKLFALLSALPTDGSVPSTTTLSMWIELIQAYSHLELHEEMLEAIKIGPEAINPNHPFVFEERARALFEMGRHEESVSVLKEGIERTNGNKVLVNSLEHVQGELAEAEGEGEWEEDEDEDEDE